MPDLRHAGYSPHPLPAADPAARPSTEARAVEDVVEAIERLSTRGERLALWGRDGVFPKQRYTSDGQGDALGKIHFQGIQRLRNSYAVVSGGDKLEPASHLFFFDLGSRYVRGPWGSNLVRRNMPPDDDVIVNVVALESPRWHAGGLGLLGDVLVVPLEGDIGASRTVFLDVSDPRAPRHIPIDIEGASDKAGAAALTRLPNGYFLCAVYRDEQQTPSGWFDFYLSQSTDLFAGFLPVPLAQLHYGNVVNAAGRKPAYQTVAFLPQEKPNGDWQLFLLGTWNTSPAAPTLPGADWLDVHRVELDPALLGDPPVAVAPRLSFVSPRQFFCRDGWGNFAAAGGLHVDDRGRLQLYSAYHWRYDGTLSLTEFPEELPRNAAPITAPADAWIDLFDHADFQGRRLRVRGEDADGNHREYASIAVEGASFNDAVSSARWQIPDGHVYRLYAAPRYGETEGVLDLEGNGRVREISDFKLRRFNDRVSSSRWI